MIIVKTFEELDEKTKQEFENMLREFTPDDLVQLILVEAGYEEATMPFEQKELQRLLYRNYDRLPTLKKSHVYFKTNGTFPYSPYVERIYQRLIISHVLQCLPGYKLANGTREYCAENKAQPDPIEMEVIKELGVTFRKKMLGEPVDE